MSEIMESRWSRLKISGRINEKWQSRKSQQFRRFAIALAVD